MARVVGPSARADVLVVGAGVLGVSFAYWLSSLYDCRVVVMDMESAPAGHTSSRNTGVIHRPFYLNPQNKKVFARSCLVSYGLWRDLAAAHGLPWHRLGTMNVSLGDGETRTLEKYLRWGKENGMGEGELELVAGTEVGRLEPKVRCEAALRSKTDVSVDFGAMTRKLAEVCLRQGVVFLFGAQVESVTKTEGGLTIGLVRGGARSTLSCGFMVNAAGGGALGISHACGLGEDFSLLHFRGEYWVVDQPFGSSVGTNVYRPPRHPQFPFLDPHLVVRVDGSRQIGPNAVLVTGPYEYAGQGLRKVGSLLSRPMLPKARLLADGEFLTLLSRELRSSLSKGSMCERVEEFIPELRPSMLSRRGTSGIRSPVLDRHGFVPEAVVIRSESSAHVINYNSPGATGAPGFSARIVSELGSSGYLGRLRPRERPLSRPWTLDAALSGPD